MQACRVAADLASSNAVSARKVAAYDPEDATKLASTASWKAYEVNQTGPCFCLTRRYMREGKICLRTTISRNGSNK
jgi:hypothetical protein